MPVGCPWTTSNSYNLIKIKTRTKMSAYAKRVCFCLPVAMTCHMPLTALPPVPPRCSMNDNGYFSRWTGMPLLANTSSLAFDEFFRKRRGQQITCTYRRHCAHLTSRHATTLLTSFVSSLPLVLTPPDAAADAPPSFLPASVSPFPTESKNAPSSRRPT